MPSDAASVGRRIGEHYDVLAELGRGGMACVYRVVDTRSGASLALKQLLPQPDVKRARDAARLFEREFHTLAQLAHPRVIAVYDYGIDAAGPYYTMELLDGGDLRERSPLPWRDACELIFDVCSSLALLHSRRLVHRDVSPRNVRCTHDGHAKLIDFGAMVPMGANAQVVGTPPFIAPEAVYKSTLDARTDLFSLGNALYFALTGRLAYPAKSFAHLTEVWAEKPLPASVLVPELPPALNALVMSMIGLEAALRPRSAFEVMQRLASVAGITRAEPLSVSNAYLSTPTLVAREAPLTELRERLMRTAHGRGRGVFLCAEAGLGRSRILETIALEAKMAGACVLSVSATSGASYLDVGRALAEQLVELAREPALAAARDAGSYDELFEMSGDSSVQLRSFARAGADRSALQAALTRWLLHVTKARPLMIAADDVELMDDGSIALLASLAERARSHALLLLASAQQKQRDILPGSLDVLRNRCAVLELRPLDQSDTEQLLGSVFGDVPNLALLSARIHGVAAGSPREVMAVARHLVDRNVIAYDSGSWSLPEKLAASDLPASAEDALRGRVQLLCPLARRLAELLALAPHDTFTREDCAALQPSAAALELDQALAELVTQQIVTSDGERYDLADRPFAGVLSDELDASARGDRYRALAELSERNASNQFATARLWLLAGEPARGVEQMLRYIRGVKDRVEFLNTSRISADEAVRTLARALQAALALKLRPRDCHDLRQWLMMLSVAANENAYWLVAREWFAQLEEDSGLADHRRSSASDPGQRLTQALTAAAERYKATPENDRVYSPDEAIRFLVQYVAVSIAIGARELDAGLLMTLPEVLEPFAPLSPLLAAIWQNALATRESSCYRQTERARARWVEVYDKLAHLSSPDPKLLASIRFAIAFGVGVIEAATGCTTANQWADVLDQEPLQRVNAMYMRRVVRLQQGDLEGAERYRRQAELLALQSTMRQMFTNLITLELGVHAASWDLTGVKQLAARIEPLAQRHRGWVPYKHLAEGHYRRLLGELPAALEAYQRCLTLATPEPREPTRSTVAWPPAAAGYAETLIALGRTEDARAFAASALEQGRALELEHTLHDVSLVLALAEAKLGAHADAAARLERLLEQQLAQGVTGVTLGATYEARARIAIWAGEQDVVERFAKSTAEQYRHGRSSPLGARYERLMEEARGAGVRVLPALSPYESTIFGTSMPASRSLASSTVFTVMTGAADPESRAERALRLLCESERARAGHLYLARGDRLRLAASTTGEYPDDMLQSMVSDFWAQQHEHADMDTAQIADDTDGIPEWKDRAGRVYQLRLLTGRLEGELVPAGVVLLAHGDGEHAATEMPLMTELATFLLRTGDSTRSQ